jgi:SAM-dependent methyltransferase
MMRGKHYEAEYWDQVANSMANGQEFDELLAEQYRRIHLNLLARWADLTTGQRILKTDLFAEALCPSRAFLWDMLKTNSNVIGIDISAELTYRAKTVATKCAPNPAEYISCDIRQLPFASNSFDLIVSDSSVDHFLYKSDILAALSELSRVLKPGGTLIITMDNKNNLTEPLFRLWIHLGLSSFFIGRTYSIKELKQALTKTGLFVTDSTAVIHNPRFFTKVVIAFLRKVEPTRLNHWIRRGLVFLDSLENRKTKYLTAQFIVAKAVKPSN